jgi:predicted AAA+ superfamily ATPase
MSVSKDIIRRCLRDKREEIESATVISRSLDFEENGNYVMVGLRHVGKSYMLYQRVKQ